MAKKNVAAFDEAPATNSAALKSLLVSAKELLDLDKQLEDLKALMGRLDTRRTELSNSTIPNKMAEIGITEFATPNGVKLKIEDFILGGLPKEDLEKRAGAIRQLEEWGADSIIKNVVSLSFAKSQHNEAAAIADDLRKRGFDVNVASDVHASTYKAYIRERLRNGEEVDSEKMGVMIGRQTKVIIKKEKP